VNPVPPQILSLPVLWNREAAAETFLLALDAGGLAADVVPGQFVMLSFPGSRDPLLPRPFAVFDRFDNRLTILYRKVGTGTGILARCREGETLRILGPLGNGYSLPESPDAPSLVVAGGIGFASVYFLLRRLLEQGRPVTLLYGTRSSPELYPLHEEERAYPKLTVFRATEDGRTGFSGNVLQLLQSLRDRNPDLLEGHPSIYACGPVAMFRALGATLHAEGRSAQFSLEARMACGYGVCQGCVVQTRPPGGEGVAPAYKKVCAAGPVFVSDQIDWDVLR